MKSSLFGARTSGSRISSSSPKSMLGIGRWAFWRCLLVYLLTSRVSLGFWSGSGGWGCDLWTTGLGMLVHLGDSETMQGNEEQGREVLPHSPCGQLGLPGKVRAGVRGTIVTVKFYFGLGFYGQLPAPWSGVWVKEWGFGQGHSGQRAGEGVWVEDRKNIFGVPVSYEDLCLFQLCEQEGVPHQQLSPNNESSWEGTWEWRGRYGPGESNGS